MTQTAIVTGGTRGIGYAITKALRNDGFEVAALYSGNEEAAQKAAQETGCHVFKVDICDYNACQDIVSKIEEQIGPIAVLVNNAGITRDGVLHKMDVEDWSKVIETNLSACFYMCKSVLPGMRGRNQGRVINISSINGQKGQLGQTNYSAAKAGMIGLTKSLALESARKNITVNSICPGYIQTDMTGAMREDILDAIVSEIPLGRLGQPDEIAALVSYLCSENAAFITGATLSANGGQYMA